MTNTDLIIKKTVEYLNYPSAVGYEQPFINKLEKDFKSLQLRTERHSGLLSVKENRPKTIPTQFVNASGTGFNFGIIYKF
ncbi:MAG: hypothetical protein ACSHXF_04290 [Aquaticitalea sp.]